MKYGLLIISHIAMLVCGVGVGIYLLPILIQPTSPSQQAIASVMLAPSYRGEFSRDRADSDFLHWGKGKLVIDAQSIAFSGELAPGPDYKLYLSPTFIETEADFLANKEQLVRVGDVKTFDRFILPIPSDVDVANYTTAIVWCETFSQFITSAKYR
ncbi:DM13 domain-containing protein [Vibrio vulnificus]|uniref:DM13 domain-containing protein n=1 Tax=Vibrio vulnificus TaxID=672 RepID=UPI00287AF41A|nr:DM13 domain-containing protein [Vibrio vulnificus]MDS1779244.1 DM13 domain-containing protein [Vibrio vulnificus]MDS1807560.1 DM13 domain-containing protein [Vibrio vulnificus]